VRRAVALAALVLAACGSLAEDGRSCVEAYRETFNRSRELGAGLGEATDDALREAARLGCEDER